MAANRDAMAARAVGEWGSLDVLVTAATPPSRAAMAATRTTPIVFVAVGEPIAVGLVKSMAHPGGNITGLSLLTNELSGRRLKLLVDCVGKARTVAVIKNPANRVHETFLEETRAAAEALGLRLVPLDAGSAPEIDRAFDSARAISRLACSSTRSSSRSGGKCFSMRASASSASPTSGSCPRCTATASSSTKAD